MSVPSSSTIDDDLHVGDTTLDHAMLMDEEDEHYSTGYSEFCDDDAILGAQDTICDSSPTGSSPATTLGKRKSPEDSGLSDSVSASYKRQTFIRSDSATEPYIIVSLNQISLSIPKKLPFLNTRRTTRASNARWRTADFLGGSNGKSPVWSHAVTAHGKTLNCVTSISFEKRGPVIPSRHLMNLLRLTSRTYSGGIKKTASSGTKKNLATKDHQRRLGQLYVITSRRCSIT
jgi:hypothetical protein